MGAGPRDCKPEDPILGDSDHHGSQVGVVGGNGLADPSLDRLEHLWSTSPRCDDVLAQPMRQGQHSGVIAGRQRTNLELAHDRHRDRRTRDETPSAKSSPIARRSCQLTSCQS